MNPIDVMGDILKFRGFKESSLKDKMKWLFVLIHFFSLLLLYHLILYIPLLPDIIKERFKRR